MKVKGHKNEIRVMVCKLYITLTDIIHDTKVQYNNGHLMTSAFSILTKDQDLIARSNVIRVEVFTFSECYLVLVFFFFFFYIYIYIYIEADPSLTVTLLC